MKSGHGANNKHNWTRVGVCVKESETGKRKNYVLLICAHILLFLPLCQYASTSLHVSVGVCAHSVC